jgi:hypothetical protein
VTLALAIKAVDAVVMAADSRRTIGDPLLRVVAVGMNLAPACLKWNAILIRRRLPAPQPAIRA